MSSPRQDPVIPIVVASPATRSPRPGRVGDVALTVALLAASYAAFLIGALFALLTVGITDARGGASAVLAIGVVLAVVGLVATVLAVVLQRMRRRTWWLGAAALLLTVVGWIVAFAVYVATLA